MATMNVAATWVALLLADALAWKAILHFGGLF
jgi:hypothetical protein